VKGSWKVAGDSMSDKINRCVNDLSNWSKDRFGDVPSQIKIVQKKLNDLNKQTQHEGVMSEIRRVEARLNDLVEIEEIWWAQRSRAVWLKHGDKNINFFHQKASQRKSRNWVDSICNDHGENFDNEEDIALVFNNFFQDLFSTSHPERITEVVQVVKDRLSDVMRNILEAEFTENEVFLAAKNLKPHAAPGLGGMPALFYQQFWSIVGKDVTSFALKILNGGGNPSNINYTYICLIPKKKKPKVPSDFRPISLCNIIFKIITKTIANRLKLILPDIIGKFQSAFVPGRLITDNALLAFESFHYMRKKKRKGKKGCVALKLDMSKTYDRIEWNFLIEVLQSMVFSQKWQNLIFNYISTVSFSVLLNGSPCQKFYPQRGLCQGDPLSPYLFILCAEVFSRLLNKAQAKKGLHGIQIARGAPKINHLFFADDSLIFCRDSFQDSQTIQEILNTCQSASG